MSNAIIEKIAGYLEGKKVLNLATVTDKGTPIVSTVSYASEGATVYFVTNKNTRKAKNLVNNPAVAYTVDSDDVENWNILQGVQMTGKATLMSDKEEIGKAGKLLMTKFPQLANLPPDPDMVFIKVEPVEGYFLDNTVSFGHRDRVEY